VRSELRRRARQRSRYGVMFPMRPNLMSRH
jgi:hypothetical protein